MENLKQQNDTSLSIEEFDINNKIKAVLLEAEDESETCDALNLSFGSKTLKFYPNLREKPAYTYVKNHSTLNKDRIENETRILYLQVKIICENLAEKLGELTYTLSTSNEKMKEWALSKGDEIFQWDKTEETLQTTEERGKELFLVCEKKF